MPNLPPFHHAFPTASLTQATMFLRDASGNALEFKAFADRAHLFAK